jgi:hypothetical protein
LLKYSVKPWVIDCAERKGAVASQILKSMQLSYGTNFNLIGIKHVEEISSCPAAQKFCVTE